MNVCRAMEDVRKFVIIHMAAIDVRAKKDINWSLMALLALVWYNYYCY